jgi:hypothetical protein
VCEFINTAERQHTQEAAAQWQRCETMSTLQCLQCTRFFALDSPRAIGHLVAQGTHSRLACAHSLHCHPLPPPHRPSPRAHAAYMVTKGGPETVDAAVDLIVASSDPSVTPEFTDVAAAQAVIAKYGPPTWEPSLGVPT